MTAVGSDQPSNTDGAADAEPPTKAPRRPLYPRLLRLQHVHPNGWQRAALGEGMALIGAVLAMADLASAWSIVVLPLAVAGVVKAHDVLASHLSVLPGPDPEDDEGAVPAGAAPS